jgi:hypothetical protein
MVSTPNVADGLFERMEKEAEDTCLYKRLFLDYTYGIGKIYLKKNSRKLNNHPHLSENIISSIYAELEMYFIQKTLTVQ